MSFVVILRYSGGEVKISPRLHTHEQANLWAEQNSVAAVSVSIRPSNMPPEI